MNKKIQQLKFNSLPINQRAAVNAAGELIDLKLSIEERTVKGYLTVWGVPDTYGTVMVKGCCAKSISERGPKSQSKQKIAHLNQHDTKEPLGQYTILQEDDYGLYFEALYDDIDIAERALKQIKSGTLNQFSIGFRYIWDRVEWDEEKEALLLKEIDLLEGSVVTLGSNVETFAFRSVESFEEEAEQLNEETEEFIRSIPRNQQLELRKILTRHITLSKNKPDELRQIPPEIRKPQHANKLNLSQILKSIKDEN